MSRTGRALLATIDMAAVAAIWIVVFNHLVAVKEPPKAPQRAQERWPGCGEPVGGLQLCIKTDQPSYDRGRAIVVQWKVTNLGAAEARFLRSVVPTGNPVLDYFDIRYGDAKVLCTAMPAETERTEESVTLAAGKTLGGAARIDGHYDMARAGAYSIRYESPNGPASNTVTILIHYTPPL